VVKVAAWVLPTSTTSGVWESLDSAVVSLSTRPVHCCSSIVSVEPAFSASNVFLMYSRASCGVSVPLSQTRMFAAAVVAAGAVVVAPGGRRGGRGR
jgi:hypothetical protein